MYIWATWVVEGHLGDLGNLGIAAISSIRFGGHVGVVAEEFLLQRAEAQSACNGVEHNSHGDVPGGLELGHSTIALLLNVQLDLLAIGGVCR